MNLAGMSFGMAGVCAIGAALDAEPARSELRQTLVLAPGARGYKLFLDDLQASAVAAAPALQGAGSNAR